MRRSTLRPYVPDLAAGLFAAGFYWWLLVRTPRTEATVLVDQLVFLVPGLAVGLASFANASLTGIDRRTRVAWSFFAADALALWFTGGVWAILARTLPGVIGPIGDGWAAPLTTLPSIVALLLFPRTPPEPGARPRAWLDSALAAIGGIALVFHFELRAFMRDPSMVTLGIVASSIDWLVFVAATHLYLHTPGWRRRAYGWFVGAAVLWVVSDYVYGSQANYVDGDAVDGLYFAVWLAKWCGVRTFYHRAHGGDAEPATALRYRDSTLPYLVVGVAFLLLLTQIVGNDADSLLLASSAATMSGLLIVRHIVELRESRRLFAAQLSQEERFRSLVQHSSDVIALLDGTGRVVYLSPSVGSVLGPDTPLRVGAAIGEVLAFDSDGDRDRLMSLTPGATLRLTGEVADAARGRRQVEVVAHDLRHHPSVAAIVLTVRDVTDRVDLERQLRHAQKLEALGVFAGGLAHDFNNVLAVIRGYTEVVKEDLPAGAPAREETEHIDRAVDRAAGVTRQLLAFSRRQAVRPVVLDLNRVIVDLEPMLTQLLTSSTRVEVECAPDLSHVKVDQGQIEQVVLNLAANARDAMPGGGVLRLSTRNVIVPGDDAVPGGAHYVALDVSDEGVGMSEDLQARIFEPFFTTKPLERGSGLGLAMVYGIVSQAGGSVSVRSAPDQGTTFTIQFPMTTEPLPGPLPAEGRPAVDRPGTVLLVEDEAGVRRFTRRLLEQQGYAVREAASGEGALELLEREAPEIDVLLTDLVMPGMDGRALVRSFQVLRPGVPIICMSGFAAASDQQDLGPAVTSLLPKPFTADALMRALAASRPGDQTTAAV